MDTKSLVILIVIVAIILIILVLGIKEEKQRRAQLVKKIKSNYGKLNKKKLAFQRQEGVRGYLDKHMDNKDASYLDDITWHDLDMDTLFTMLNNTYSACGEEYLYAMLRLPKHDRDKLNVLEKDISSLASSDNKKNRYAILEALSDIGKNDTYSVYEYLDATRSVVDKCKNGIHIFGLLFLMLSVVCIFVYTGPGIIMTIAALCFNVITYFRIKSELIVYINSLKYVMRLYHAAKSIVNKVDKLDDNLANVLADMKDRCRNLLGFAGKSKFVFASASGQSSIFSFIRDYFNMLTHIDLIMFNSMIKGVDKSYDDIDKLIENLGYMEYVIAIGSFREALETYCLPEFMDNDINNDIEANNLYHPYITNPVKNSIVINKPVLITGSNASGKSTFLRTVALANVMAQTIHTVCADSFRTKDYYVYSSMSLSDNLLKGDSYYMAEIKAIKRILDFASDAGKNSNVLAFVDEVLRGTNTVERIAASTEILRYFADNNILCMAATHDIELTSLLGDDGIYDNYHFEEEIVDDDIRFNYRLNEGKASSRNAIKLLDVMGFGHDITKTASDMAETFTKSGEWRLV